MRPFSSCLLVGCAFLALTAPAAAQEPPVIVVPPAEAPDPDDVPAVVPAGDPVEAPTPPAPPIPEVWSPVPVDGAGRSAYGLYLSGRLAGIRGDRGEAARLLALSHALTPEQPVLGDEAFRAALFTGDPETVVRLAPSVQDTPLLVEAGRLFGMVLDLSQGDGEAAWTSLQARAFPAPYSSVARYLAPSVAAAAGDWETALRPVTATPGDPAELILRLQRARLLEVRRRYDEAETEYRALVAQPIGARLFGVAFGEFLERRGRRAEAAARYRASLDGPAPDPAALDGLQRAAARGRPPATPTPVEGAAAALVFAAMETTEYEQHELSAIYLRLARLLKPDDLSALRLGLALAGAEQETPAREAFALVGADNPVLYAGAQYNLALSLGRDERPAEALEALRRADAAAPGQTRIALELVTKLLEVEQPAEALAVLDRPEVDTPGQSAAVRFLRGAALEALGRVEEAEAELWTALQAQPEDPTMLNHLGYLWVDSGRRVEQGAEMIARAAAAEPDNGNIQDSLGWAQYRQGRYEAAVETLEGAVEKEPANAEINDHLGDAYWQVGRRREAAWQWSRVLTLEPEPERRAEVERKLAQGLEHSTPAGAARP